MYKRYVFGLIVGLWVLVLCLPSTHAQDKTSISGTVTDENGGSVTGAQVVLRSRLGNQLSKSTDQNGAFAFSSLGPGGYLLEVKASGFASFTSEELQLRQGESKSVSVRLTVAGVNATVVITPTGTVQRSDEVAKALTTITADEVDAAREVGLADALRNTAGLRVQQQGSPGAITSLRLRGQRNFDTSILFDGLRIRDAADINGSALPFITDFLVNNIDRVEVLRGSGSSIYGTNAIGGVINLVPETGWGSPRFEADFEGGGLASFRERIQGSGSVTDKAGFSFGVSRLDVRRGVDGNDEYGNLSGSGRLQFSFTPFIDLAASFLGSTSNGLTNNSPQPLSFAPVTGFPRAIEGVTFQPDFNNPDQGRRNILRSLALRFSQSTAPILNYTIAYQHVRTRRRNYNGPELDPSFALPFGEFEFNSINNGGTDTLDARANLRFNNSNLLTGGFEFENETLFQQFISAFGTAPGTTDRQRTFAFFAQHQLTLLESRLHLALGVRQQFFRIRAADRPGFLAQITAENSTTGDGAIAYFVRSTGTKLRAHVGNGFRAPSLFERFGDGVFQNIPTRFGDPTLRPEQSIAFDAGVDQRLANEKLMLGFTYFYTRLQRVIDFKSFRSFFDPGGDPDPLGVDRTSGFLNFPGGISRGIEAYVESAPYRGATLRSSYTYTNADRFTVPGGFQPQFVTPAHQFGFSFTQRYRRLLAFVGVERIGEYLAPVFPVTFRFDGRTKVDTFVTYEHKLDERRSLSLFGGADNVFDQTYFENGFRAPGIVAKGGIRLRF